MTRLRNPRSGVVVKVDDDTAARLTAEGWESEEPKKAQPAPAKSTRKPRK